MDHPRTFKERLSFLQALDVDLASELLLAAQLGYDDPNSAAVKLRRFSEIVARRHLAPGYANDSMMFYKILEKLRTTAAAPSGILGSTHSERREFRERTPNKSSTPWSRSPGCCRWAGN